MTSTIYTSPPGYGGDLFATTFYSQAARLPNHIVKLSGQGGWDPVTGEIAKPDTPAGRTAQIEQTFSNIDIVLRHTGLRGWEDVHLVRAFVIGMKDDGIRGVAAACLRKWCPHKPLFTWIGVAQLGSDDMRIEIEVEAFDHVAASKM